MLFIAATLALGGALAWFSPAGDAARDILKAGVLTSQAPIDRKFEGDTVEHLKALYIAADLYQKSEEKYPISTSWMDDLLPRLRTADLKTGEAEKKFIRPDLEGKAGQFGYAINTKCAGKYRPDIKDPKAILFFEADQTSKNLAGEPQKIAKKGAKAITIDGMIVTL